FIISCSVDIRLLPPFPTRRSSDLHHAVVDLHGEDGGGDRQHVSDQCRDTRFQPGPPVPLERSLEPVLSQLAGKIPGPPVGLIGRDRKSTRLNSSHVKISYAVFCLK